MGKLIGGVAYVSAVLACGRREEIQAIVIEGNGPFRGVTATTRDACHNAIEAVRQRVPSTAHYVPKDFTPLVAYRSAKGKRVGIAVIDGCESVHPEITVVVVIQLKVDAIHNA
jgi:hypothetical protein